MSTLIIHRRAANYLQRLPKTSKERIKDILRKIAANPLAFPGVKPMAGDWGGYHRVRIGSLRIIFWFDEKEDIVYVDHIGPRGDIYKT